MRLIITEKNNSAKKIAQILSAGNGVSESATYKVPYYEWSDEAGDHLAIGLKGHVMNRAYTDEFKSWQETDPRDMIDAELISEPTDKNVLKAVRKVAKDAERVVIATDFDREGELIGLEALTEVLDVNEAVAKDVSRARYSALTKDEIERAFGELDDLSYPLAHAAAARQDIDLIWGAVLTRAVSRSTRRFGSNFLSVGRVQSPTLGLIVERELERRAHVPKPFWELFATFQPEGADSFEAHHATDKFWDEAEAKAAFAGTKSPGRVASVTAKKTSRKPPAPYNTTAFTTDASSRLGITPKQAMRLAEDLYMDGFISYPRTDNTVYPPSLPLRELVTSLVKIDDFAAARPLLDKSELTPTRGKKETQDHPPIYPTQAVYPGALDGPKRRVYELVVRRFLATFSEPMVSESTRADIEAGSETYFVRGSVVIDPGYAGIYTYARSKDAEIPKLAEGQELELVGDPRLDAKETQPPSRIGQGTLIELMEERGLGTKATRADIIQKLYDRGYVFNNPPQPSETGIAMYKAFSRFVPEMATPEMTAKLEAEMDQIAGGEISKDEVLADSREMLHTTYTDITDNSDDLAKEVWQGMDDDKLLGPCPVCEREGRAKEDGSPNQLRIIDTKGGKRFVGCQGWKRSDPEDPKSEPAPDACTFSRPLPGRNFQLWKVAERCPTCGEMPRLRVQGFRSRPWELCLNEDCPDMVKMREQRAERQAAREAREAAKAATEANGDSDSAGEDGAESKKPAKRSTRTRKKPSPGTRRVKRAGTRAKSGS